MAHRILVIGSTGLVGNSIIEQAIDSEKFQDIYAISRRDLKFSSNKLHLLESELDHLSTLVIPENISAGICCLGTTRKKAGSKQKFYEVDHDGTIRFAEMCIENGIREFHLVSSIGADAESNSFYLNTKGKVEKEIQRMGFEAIHIYRPSLLLGPRKEKRILEGAFSRLSPLYRKLLKGPLHRFRPTPASTLANCILKNVGVGGRNLHHGKNLFR